MATFQITHFPSRTFRLQEEGSLLLLKIISSAECNHCQLLWGWPLITHTKDGKLLAPLALCPACWTAEPMKATFFFLNSQHTRRGQRVAYTLRHINQQGIDQMSPPTGIHYPNSMHRRLLEKGRAQNNTEYIKFPPFLHMESSSLRCQDKT